jgi:signal transduction histidine kinase
VQLVEDHEATVRVMGLLLRPSMLDDLGLIPALNWLAREVSSHSGMEVTVDADEACNQLSDDYRTCIYRVAQEALDNAVLHAKAAKARIALRHEASQVRLEVQDDGRGFNRRYTKGIGILGIEERARYLGGMCKVDSEPGNGACVSIQLPLPPTRDPGRAKSGRIGAGLSRLA